MRVPQQGVVRGAPSTGVRDVDLDVDVDELVEDEDFDDDEPEDTYHRSPRSKHGRSMRAESGLRNGSKRSSRGGPWSPRSGSTAAGK